MSIVATAPQGEVAITWMIAVPVAVPEIVLPTTLRPAGKPWTHTVAPGDATITATNGRPTVPPRFEEAMVGRDWWR